MRRRESQLGYSFAELLVSLAVFSFAITAVGGLLVQNSRINRSEQLRAEVQANARSCVSLIAGRLRSAGWDPLGLGFSAIVLDADPDDAVSYIEVYADLDADGTLDGAGESVLIRHSGDVIEWQPAAAAAFVPLAAGISNDADGDGDPEPLFVSDGESPPRRIRVRVTAQSVVDDPRTGQPYRYTLESEVALRSHL